MIKLIKRTLIPMLIQFFIATSTFSYSVGEETHNVLGKSVTIIILLLILRFAISLCENEIQCESFGRSMNQKMINQLLINDDYVARCNSCDSSVKFTGTCDYCGGVLEMVKHKLNGSIK